MRPTSESVIAITENLWNSRVRHLSQHHFCFIKDIFSSQPDTFRCKEALFHVNNNNFIVKSLWKMPFFAMITILYESESFRFGV